MISTSRKGSATTHPRDVHYGPDPIRLVWHKYRWRCRETQCHRQTFTESLPGRPGPGPADHAHQVSWPVAHAAFIEHVTDVLEEPLPAVSVLGIDETRRGKPIWGQDPVTGRWRIVHDRWHTGIVDAAGTGGLLAHIEGRTAARVSEWLSAQPASWKDGITHVTIDLSASYAKAVTDALPTAVIVADKFYAEVVVIPMS